MYQLKDGFKLGTDTVLLSWFAASFVSKAKANSANGVKMLELGANCGGASLLALGRIRNSIVDSVEIMREPYHVSLMNVELNSLEDRYHPYIADVRDLPSEVRQKQYDVVFMNPPFFRREDGPAVPEEKSIRLAGRFEENGTLSDFVRTASARVVPTSGYVVMVMHGDRLFETMSLYKEHGLTPTHLLNVHPMVDKSASMFLLAGKKGSKTKELKILPPLILNEKNDKGDIIVTPQLTDIYEKEHTNCFI